MFFRPVSSFALGLGSPDQHRRARSHGSVRCRNTLATRLCSCRILLFPSSVQLANLRDLAVDCSAWRASKTASHGPHTHHPSLPPPCCPSRRHTHTPTLMISVTGWSCVWPACGQMRCRSRPRQEGCRRHHTSDKLATLTKDHENPINVCRMFLARCLRRRHWCCCSGQVHAFRPNDCAPLGRPHVGSHAVPHEGARRDTTQCSKRD